MIWRDENFPWDNLSQKWTGNDAGNGEIVGRENRESRNNIFTFSKPHSPKKKINCDTFIRFLSISG